MKLILAKSAGFCYGVRRAVKLCREAAGECKSCVTLGPIIHNASVTGELAKMGVREAGGVCEINAGDTVIIRSHGAKKSDIDTLRKLGADLIDATCPNVAKIHSIVRSESEAGRKIIIIGEKNHPEIEAISSWCGDCVIIETAEQLLRWINESPENKDAPITAVCQTTNTRDVFDSCCKTLKKECTNCEIFDTICNATLKRQEEAKEISCEADAMIVIGGKSSANSHRLAEICRKYCKRVFFVETADELDISNLSESDTVGITAGASTPAWIIEEVCQMLSDEMNIEETGGKTQVSENSEIKNEEEKPVDTAAVSETEAAGAEPEENGADAAEDAGEKAAAGEETAETEDAGKAEAPEADESGDDLNGEAGINISEETADASEADAVTEEDEDGNQDATADETFEEMLEKSIKTLTTGQKVTGTIAAITQTEISVDLGTKQSGYIPLTELTDDPTVKAEDIIKIGDLIETFVLRVNDVEGTVMLSKKRLDSVKNWEDIETAKNDKTIVEGTVTEENKGGIVVSVKGVRVFVPASQTGIPKNEPMTPLIKTKVRLRVTEVNHSRRRVVGSIRSVLNDERREKMEKIWADIEEGKIYSGVVKSMTSYGAFVDIGGIDGMVHVSELSWTRINQPSDLLKIGDEIEVYVISFDREKNKISLGYKKDEDNPWVKFTTAHSIGETVNVKIVKLMPFGAFAEIIPGVDGLIHISQITDHRIGLPSEVLSEGMTADVKITDIDMEKHKVSLSIRALMNEPVSAPLDEPMEIVYETSSETLDTENSEEDETD